MSNLLHRLSEKVDKLKKKVKKKDRMPNVIKYSDDDEDESFCSSIYSHDEDDDNDDSYSGSSSSSFDDSYYSSGSGSKSYSSESSDSDDDDDDDYHYRSKKKYQVCQNFQSRNNRLLPVGRSQRNLVNRTELPANAKITTQKKKTTTPQRGRSPNKLSLHIFNGIVRPKRTSSCEQLCDRGGGGKGGGGGLGSRSKASTATTKKYSSDGDLRQLHRRSHSRERLGNNHPATRLGSREFHKNATWDDRDISRPQQHHNSSLSRETTEKRGSRHSREGLGGGNSRHSREGLKQHGESRSRSREGHMRQHSGSNHSQEGLSRERNYHSREGLGSGGSRHSREGLGGGSRHSREGLGGKSHHSRQSLGGSRYSRTPEGGPRKKVRPPQLHKQPSSERAREHQKEELRKSPVPADATIPQSPGSLREEKHSRGGDSSSPTSSSCRHRGSEVDEEESKPRLIELLNKSYTSAVSSSPCCDDTDKSSSVQPIQKHLRTLRSKLRKRMTERDDAQRRKWKDENRKVQKLKQLDQQIYSIQDIEIPKYEKLLKLLATVDDLA